MFEMLVQSPDLSLCLRPTTDPPYSPRLASNARIMIGESPGNERIAVALPRIYEARASITDLQTRPLRNKKVAGDVIETTAHPGQRKVFRKTL
ncbi:hypothetical protein E4U31_005193 [Claviceps sp. LM219 group G6]|nr:hypothetical protein E4U31_005193 [Claviceps sp. LM219 group G6]